MTAHVSRETFASETLRGAFRNLVRDFCGAGIDTPELDARLLLCAACGLTHEEFATEPERLIGASERDKLSLLAGRRLRREPVSRILGKREFWGLAFALNPDTLDPRPDSETLIEAALELVGEQGLEGEALRILDLGTGSGCLLLSLLHELPNASGVGVDVSAGALRAARTNADRLGLAKRAQFVQGSWFDALEGRFDVVLSNPPYISRDQLAKLPAEVARFDPSLALDGGVDGLDAYRTISDGLAAHLAPGGMAIFELGQGQGSEVESLLVQAGAHASQIRFWRDLAGAERCVSISPGKRPFAAEKRVGNWERSG